MCHSQDKILRNDASTAMPAYPAVLVETDHRLEWKSLCRLSLKRLLLKLREDLNVSTTDFANKHKACL
jgi:hypothetical protein